MHEFFYIKPIFDNKYDTTGMKLMLYNGPEDYEIIEPPFSPYCFLRKQYAGIFRDNSYIFKYYGITGNVVQSDLVEITNHDPVVKVEFTTLRDIIKFKNFIKNSTHLPDYTDVFESDIPYVRRIMTDLGLEISKKLRVAYIDIETDDSKGIPSPKSSQIISIAIVYDTGEEVFLENVSRTREEEIKIIEEFVTLMKSVAAIATWYGGDSVYNPRGFDVPYLAQRYPAGVEVFEKELEHLKYFDLYAIYKFEMGRIGKAPPGGFHLDNVAMLEFGNSMRKLDKRGSKVYALSREDLREYNLQDARIVRAIDMKYHYTKTKIDMARLCNLLLLQYKWDRKLKKEIKHDELKPLILTDQLLLKYSRSLGMVLPDRHFGEDREKEGAFVLEPKIGLFSEVQNYDIVQMYPTIMIQNKLSPDKDKILIPHILQDLMKKRKVYKNQYLSDKKLGKEWLPAYILQYNYKVLANIIYGAFGNPNSRIFDAAKAEKVTEVGRGIANDIRNIVTSFGYDVIYQDTDSAFVAIEQSKAKALEQLINAQIAPYSVELGEYYKAMLFVEAKTKQGAAKKKYSGLYDEEIQDEDGNVIGVKENQLKIVGMEAIKRDYCVLAKEAQTMFIEKLLRMKMQKKTIESSTIQQCIARTKQATLSGLYDYWLILSKGVKELDDYEYNKDHKEHKGLPHIRAYKKLVDRGYPYVFDVSYVFTTDDVEPLINAEDLEAIRPKIDRERYWQKQIYPLIDRVLSVARRNVNKTDSPIGLMQYDFR